MLRSAKRPLVSGTSEDLRTAKVQELKLRCPGLKERIDGCEFSLTFSSMGISYDLIITLPSGFPFAGPILVVQPPALHPLLDETSTVCGLPDLTAFSIHASLADIVHQVLQNFILLPLTSRQDCVSQSGNGSGSMFVNGGHPLRASSIYHQVNNLSLDDLREWSTDELKIKEFVDGLPHVQAKLDHLREAAEVNEALAKANLLVKAEVEKKRDEVLSRCEEFTQKRTQFIEHQESFQSMAKIFSPDSIKDELIQSAQQSERQSDAIAEQFLEKEVGVDEFLKTFMESRTKSHERSAKAELLQRQLEQLYQYGF